MIQWVLLIPVDQHLQEDLEVLADQVNLAVHLVLCHQLLLEYPVVLCHQQVQEVQEIPEVLEIPVNLVFPCLPVVQLPQ